MNMSEENEKTMPIKQNKPKRKRKKNPVNQVGPKRFITGKKRKISSSTRRQPKIMLSYLDFF